MSYIAELFKNQREIPKDGIKLFIEKSESLDIELEALDKILQNTESEKVLIVFYIEILAKAIKKQEDFSKFSQIVLNYIENNLKYKNSIILLNTLRLLSNTRFYLPIIFYITRILEFAIKAGRVVRGNKQYTYDNIRLSNDDLNKEELQVFVIQESIKLIKYQCLMFGNSIGFPEIAFVLCNDLRTNCKVDCFKETIGDLIRAIAERKEYIEKKRSVIVDKTLNMKVVLEFEKNLDEWVF